MTMRLEAFGGSPSVLERLIRREDLSGDEAAPALAALLRSLGFERVRVVFEQPPAT
jgi:acetylornithine deacetylase/succinyl-diaminopimelate desuccinylase-like protein